MRVCSTPLACATIDILRSFIKEMGSTLRVLNSLSGKAFEVCQSGRMGVLAA